MLTGVCLQAESGWHLIGEDRGLGGLHRYGIPKQAGYPGLVVGMDIHATGKLDPAGVIAVAAVSRLLDDTVVLPEREGQGIAILVISILLTTGLVLWQRHVARRTGNKVVMADSLHYMADLVPNIGAILALWASAALGLHQIDSIVALAAAGLLAVGATRIGKGAWDALMDRQADPQMIAGISEIADGFDGVLGFHDLKTRVAGSRVFVNIHIELDGDQSLHDAHAIGAALRRAIIAAYPQADVLIHKDPAGVERHPDDPRT